MVSSVLLFTTGSSDLALDYGDAKVFLDLACFFLMVMMMVQMLRILVISILLPIVLLLEPSTCSHLVSVLLDILELVLEDVVLHVGGYLGLGALPRLDGLHNLVLLSSLDVKVFVDDLEGGEDSVSSVLLVHVVFLSHGSLNIHIHGDLFRLGVVVPDALEGGEGGVSCVLLLHDKLLSSVPVNDTLAT